MRAIWKGSVTFGLVSVPVRVYGATQEHDIRFHQVHREDGGRIRLRRVCSVCGEEVRYEDLAKGYESADGRLVILTDEDMESLPLSTGREIDVVEFVPAEQVDPILFARSYYLEPDTRAVKPYVLLREALVASDRMAVVKVALRQRESLAVLRVRDDVIVLQTLMWPDEVRAADFDILTEDVDVRPQELSMASSLIESMAGDFDPDQFEDSYAGAVAAMVDRKLAGSMPVPVPAEAASAGADVMDLLSALQASVDRARQARGEERATARPVTKRAPAKRAPVKKVAAGRGAVGRASSTGKVPAAKATPAKAVTGKAAVAKTSAAKTSAAKTGKAAAKRAAPRKTA